MIALDVPRDPDRYRGLLKKYDRLSQRIADLATTADSADLSIAYAERAWLQVQLADSWPYGVPARRAWTRGRRTDQVLARRVAGATREPEPALTWPEAEIA